MSGRASGEGLSGLDVARFRMLVADAAGFDVPDARKTDIEQAVMKAARAIGTPDTDVVFEKLTGHEGRAHLQALIADLAIGETYFFRNQPQFRALERHILPRLIKRRATERRLRVWSAACSTGEEPYSIAILLDHLLPDLANWDITILGTDVNRASLDNAAEGLYGEWSFRGVPDDIRSTYFAPEGHRFRLHQRIRHIVSFDYLNLVDRIYPSAAGNIGELDLILCRNVLMYFREPVANDVVRRLYGCLSEPGWLLVGHADMCPALSEHFSVERFPGAIAYRKGRAESRTRESRDNCSSALKGSAHRQTARPTVDREPTGSARITGTPVCEPADAQPVGRTGSRDDRALFEAYRAARLHADRLELGAARNWLGVALTREPLFAPGHYLLGLVSEQEGRMEDALTHYRRCVYADPHYTPGYVAQASVLTRLGFGSRANKALDRVVDLLRGRAPDDTVEGLEPLTVAGVLEAVAAYRQGSTPASEIEGGRR